MLQVLLNPTPCPCLVYNIYLFTYLTTVIIHMIPAHFEKKTSTFVYIKTIYRKEQLIHH